MEHLVQPALAHALHLRAGWALILAGFLGGAALGVGFHLDSFLGGYASLRRRLLRLGHVALVALGGLNVLFALAPCDDPGGAIEQLASTALLIGAIAMPATCALVAWRPRLRLLFTVPVLALLTAVVGVLAHLP